MDHKLLTGISDILLHFVTSATSARNVRKNLADGKTGRVAVCQALITRYFLAVDEFIR
jgi:hypothetical protein